MKIRIGTRKSKLALIQTEMAVQALKEKRPDIEAEIVEISSRGDEITDRPIFEVGGKGVFTSELERRLLLGEIDAAVHSAKDLDINLPEGIEAVSVLKRGNHRDVLIFPKGAEYAHSDKIIIGTGSIRRRENMKRLYKNAVFKDIRGNVETRLNKLASGEYDGIVLAAAGLERLGISYDEYSFTAFEAEVFIPAACQGIIAIEAKKNSETARIFSEVSDRDTYISFETEREFLRICGGDCHTPAGIFTEVFGDRIKIICSVNGKEILSAEGNISESLTLLKGLAKKK